VNHTSLALLVTISITFFLFSALRVLSLSHNQALAFFCAIAYSTSSNLLLIASFLLLEMLSFLSSFLKLSLSTYNSHNSLLSWNLFFSHHTLFCAFFLFDSHSNHFLVR
jgi:hypothetical protein